MACVSAVTLVHERHERHESDVREGCANLVGPKKNSPVVERRVIVVRLYMLEALEIVSDNSTTSLRYDAL